MKDETKNEVEAFLKQINGLGVEDFEKVKEFSLLHYEVQKTGREMLSISAADFSWLQKRVRDTAGPLLTMAVWPEHLGYMVNAYVQGAAQAIVRRDRLSLEQYEANVGGFRLVGVVVPDHPSVGSVEL